MPDRHDEEVVGMLRHHSYRAGFLEGQLRRSRDDMAAALATLRGRKGAGLSRERLAEGIALIDATIDLVRRADALGPSQTEGMIGAGYLPRVELGSADHG